MKKRTSLIPILILSLLTSSMGQTASPQPQQNPADDEVVRITTNLVQIDAVVTDKKGRLITDLRPEEVEIYEDGRLQKITNFSFISTESGTAQPAVVTPSAPVDKTAPPPPPVRLKPEQVRRTIALIVDDLNLSFESTHFVRQGLKKYVDKQVQPGDLVAIIRTGGGIGALQQFTSDKQQLYAAIDRVRWNSRGRGGVGAFAAMATDETDPGIRQMVGDLARDTLEEGEEIDQLREEIFSAGTLGAINYVVRGMRELPGRKSILLMSDGIGSFSGGDESARRARMLERLRRLTDLANRSSVVIYTMDTRGLQTMPIEDVNWGQNPTQTLAQLQRWRGAFFESQAGLDYLSEQTGGFFVRNENDPAEGIKRVMEDQKGYYLIGYRPDESTFDSTTGRRKFHKIALKIKRPGLQHRTRTGFFGITDEKAIPQRRTRIEQLNTAISSPFTSGGVKLRLTSLYGNDPQAGSFVRSLLHIEARDLTFTQEPDGWHKADFDVMAVTFGDNGMVVDDINRIQTVRVRGETYKRILENGFVYTLTVPIKKPGAYQLRTAIRDTATQRIGSASQFIQIPDFAKNRLSLSGIALVGSEPAKASAANKATGGQPSTVSHAAEQEITETDPQAGPAVRRYRRGMVLNFGYFIYNATVNKATGQPRLMTQMRLFRDGQEIFKGSVQTLDASGQADLRRLSVSGALQLGTDMTPGEYVLQVIVTDPYAKQKYRTATQWIDFDIVK
jgi:VWFA-related protein